MPWLPPLMMSCMNLRRWYAVAGLGLLAVAGVVAWRTWRHTSAGSFDPVSAVFAVASLAVGVAALGLAGRAQRQADTDVIAVAGRLAVAVEQAESRALWQLLGEHDRAIDVRFTFCRAAAHNASGAERAGTLEEVVGYYRKLGPRRMVITGAGGSGKTVLAVKLILGLLDGRAADDPVPVRVSAASLNTSRPPDTAVADWLTEHLQQAYRLPEAAARQLVAARMILPVLDGLDEMDAVEAPGYASRAGQAIRACNAYLDGGEKAAMVLTCRISPYEALEQARVWVRDAARIQLSPVGAAAARRFLTGRADDHGRWRPVLDRVRRPGSHPLARALSTPWRLTLAAAVYDQRDPATGRYLRDPVGLTDPGLDTEDKIRDHLLGLFIPAAIAAHGNRYPAVRVHRWLGVLARYLDTNTPAPGRLARVIAGRTLSGTDLVLHELWPLAGPRAPRVLTVAVAAVLGVGLAVLLLTHFPIGYAPRQILGATAPTLSAIFCLRYSWGAWPSVFLFDSQRLKTRSGRREFRVTLVAGLVAGLALGLAFGLALGLAGGLSIGFASWLWLWLGLGVGVGVVVGLASDPSELFVVEPRQIVKINAVGSLGCGLAAALAAGLASKLVLRFGLVVTLALGLALGLTAGLLFGLACWRYITFLLCTRRWSGRWLPWRLGRFLHWCYQAGVVRVAGIGYQFRHRELQDYLARNPSSAP
jgi:NACHT domain